MSEFRRAYERGVGAAAAGNGAAGADRWADRVEEATDRAAENLRAVAEQYRNLDPHYLKGFLAESWHEGTFNIDAARRAVEEHARRLGMTSDASPDIRVTVGGTHHDWQVKYYRSGEATAKALGRPGYEGQAMVAPADQVDGIRHAADRLAAANASHRPEQAAHYAHARDHAGPTVRGEHAASDPLTHDHALAMAKQAHRGELDPAAHGLRIEDQVGATDIALQAAQAGAIGAAVAAAAQAAPYVARALSELVERGEIDPETLRDIARAAAQGGVQGALRGAVAAGIVAAGRAGVLGEAMKTVAPPVVGAAVAVALGTIADGIALAEGRISPEQFGRRLTTNAIVSSAGTAGAAIGQALIPVPVLGAIIGGMIGSAVGSTSAAGLQLALDRLSNVAFASANAELLRSMLDLVQSLQAATAATEAIQAAQARFALALQDSIARWDAEEAAMLADLDHADALSARAAAMGAEQDRALVALLARRG